MCSIKTDNKIGQWVLHLSCFDNNMKDKPCSRWQCTAVTPRNEVRLNQLNHANRWIMTRKLYMELNIGFNALEMMVATWNTARLAPGCPMNTNMGKERTPYANLSGPIEPITD